MSWCLDVSEGIDLAIFVFGAFEKDTRRALKKLATSGQTEIDVGANIGAHTLELARSIGPTGSVIALEPTDEVFERLARNIALNPDLASRIIPRKVALVDFKERELGNTYGSWNLLVELLSTQFMGYKFAAPQTPAA